MRKSYILTQPKKYFLTSEIENNRIKLICKSQNYPISNSYINSFSLEDLKSHSDKFRNCTNLEQAQQLINKSIEQNKFITREEANILDLELFMQNTQLPVNLNLCKIYNQIYPIQSKNQNNNPLKGIKREYLTLCLSPKRKNTTININSPLINENNFNITQNNSPSNLSTNLSSPNSSPVREEINNNSPSENEIAINNDNNNFNTETQINNLKNENIALKGQINSLNKQLYDLNLENQNNINTLKSMENKSNSFQEPNPEIENLKNINQFI